MDRPLLMLDVDGVLNPYGASHPPSSYADHHMFPGEEPVRVNPEHGVWITKASSVLDVAWASSWNDDANTLLVPLLQMAPLLVVRMPPPPFEPKEKVPAIAAYAQQRPVAWIDDLHTPEAHRWATGRGVPTLLITIDPAIGLTRDSIDRVIAWATASTR
ncbi:HAD domain-containing protein [Georgenia sp. H159]|uniref:HAD domain-containing protein n=1 Tax=Georgenia sp. H159 TaxID=3076115 RepID=UPI002D79F8CD|nr:HAD domain-containing protein [Georgenia sp. H159]